MSWLLGHAFTCNLCRLHNIDELIISMINVLFSDGVGTKKHFLFHFYLQTELVLKLHNDEELLEMDQCIFAILLLLQFLFFL